MKENLFSRATVVSLALAVGAGAGAGNDGDNRFRPADVFQLEYGSDPQISPDGGRVVYVRNFMDIMADRVRSNLWIVGFDGTDHRPLTSGNRTHAARLLEISHRTLLYKIEDYGIQA